MLEAQEMVNAAIEAYNSGDIRRIVDLFEPDVVVHWNGALVANNREELERWFLAGPVGSCSEFRIQKTIMVATNDTIGVHWRHHATYRDGRSVEGVGNEFWTVRNGRAATWNAVGVEHPRGKGDA